MMRRHLVSSKYLLPTRHRDKQIAIPWNIRLYNEHEVREVSTVSLVGHRSLDVNYFRSFVTANLAWQGFH
jgi:hypothetical protein